MGMLEEFIRDYDIYIILGLIGIVLVMVIIMIINNVKISKLSKRYKKFMRGSKDKNLEGLLLEVMDKVDRATDKTDEVKGMYREIEDRLDECVQKVSVVRYRAFEDMGSALSFSIALLNANDDGVIITGIYGRDESTTYAKPVEKGVPKYDLSGEEEQAMREAMGKSLRKAL